jgi:hypothetical protein
MEFDFDENFAPIRVRHPRYVFRYVKADDRLLSSIRDQYLWFSNPFDFNDPFDCRDIFDSENTQEELEWWMKRFGAKFLPPDRWEGIAERAFSNLRLRQEMAHRFYLAKMSEVSVCCFAQSCDNKLLWSHYADGHRGVCLVFDTLLLSNGGQFAVTTVNYTNEIPKWNHIRERKTHGTTGYFNFRFDKIFLGTKTLEWSYERETRFVSHNRGANPFVPDSLVGVVFGAKIASTFLLEIAMGAKRINEGVRLCEVSLDHASNSLLIPDFENEIVESPVIGWKHLDTDKKKIWDVRAAPYDPSLPL